jgi:hypothetical protein
VIRSIGRAGAKRNDGKSGSMIIRSDPGSMPEYKKAFRTSDCGSARVIRLTSPGRPRKACVFPTPGYFRRVSTWPRHIMNVFRAGATDVDLPPTHSFPADFLQGGICQRSDACATVL